MHPLIYNVSKMGRKKAVEINRAKSSAELCLKAPVFTVPESMLAEIFSIAESQNRVKHMQVGRFLDEMEKTVPPKV